MNNFYEMSFNSYTEYWYAYVNENIQKIRFKTFRITKLKVEILTYNYLKIYLLPLNVH